MALSYVLPVRMSEGEDGAAELTGYLARLTRWCNEVIVVDGSPPTVFSRHARVWDGLARHVAPDPAHTSLNGKVQGVLTGVDLASNERVIIADDDVRYDPLQLERMAQLLDTHDVVRPQNYFSPHPWHVVWDTARTLLNRGTGADFPGTLGVRRSILRATGGYDGNVMFENLELIRTVRAEGGAEAAPLDLYVRRLPPTAAHFWGQRTRQAYDDFAIPPRMALWLTIVPALVWGARRRDGKLPSALAAVTIAVAERGRRRQGGAEVFPVMASLMAPLWVLERGLCAWLAMLQRLRFGGVRYGDSIIRTAAHSPRQLRRRAVGRRPLLSSVGRRGAASIQCANAAVGGSRATTVT
jgi:hypothetical protein